MHVVFNRAPSGSFKQAELEEELRRAGTPASVRFVPADARVEVAAWEGGLPEPGPFRKAVALLATAALPLLAPDTRRRSFASRKM